MNLNLIDEILFLYCPFFSWVINVIYSWASSRITLVGEVSLKAERYTIFESHQWGSGEFQLFEIQGKDLDLHFLLKKLSYIQHLKCTFEHLKCRFESHQWKSLGGILVICSSRETLRHTFTLKKSHIFNI